MKRCGDLMTRDVRTVSSKGTALDAAVMMREHGVGFLPICDPGTGRLVAVVTDRDLVTRMCASDKKPSETALPVVATTAPLCAYEDTELTIVEDAMTKQQIARVVVVNPDGAPIGVLSLTDILREDRRGRAVRTAQGVLARQIGPGTHPDSVTRPDSGDVPDVGAPTASAAAPETTAEEAVLDSNTARSREDVSIGGQQTRDIKEFPR